MYTQIKLTLLFLLTVLGIIYAGIYHNVIILVNCLIVSIPLAVCIIARDSIERSDKINWYNHHTRRKWDNYVEIIDDDPSVQYIQMVAERAKKNKDGGYDILGIEFDDSDADVKIAYRKLMSQYHPDKLESKHLSKEMMCASKEKTQQYNKAYDTICKRRGIK